MSDEPKLFLEATFRGPRFTRPELPVDVLPELLAYKDIILRVAKEMYRARYKRTRVPKRFDDSFQLVLREIRKGSSVAGLGRIEMALAAEVLQAEPDGWDPFEDARDKVGDYVGSMANGHAPPADFPENVIPMFKELGKRLRDNEEMVLPSRFSGPVSYNQQIRKRIVLQFAETYEKEVELVGPIVMLDTDHLVFRVRADEYGTVEIPFNPVQGGVLALAHRDRHFTHVSVRALVEFDREERVKRVGNPSDITFAGELQEREIARIEGRLDELVKMEPGWCDGRGEAPSQEAREWVRGVILGLMAHDELPPPYLYATESGHIRAEWSFTHWEVAAEFRATGPSVALEAMNTGTGDYREDFVILGAVDEDLKIANFVKGIEAEGTAQ
jgi:hypothetical protein